VSRLGDALAAAALDLDNPPRTVATIGSQDRAERPAGDPQHIRLAGLAIAKQRFQQLQPMLRDVSTWSWSSAQS
jgi:hypothetical protein